MAYHVLGLVMLAFGSSGTHQTKRHQRMRRFLTVGGGYGACLALLALAYAAGLVRGGGAFAIALAAGTGNGPAFRPIRGGVSESFREPTLTRAWMRAAGSLRSLAVPSFDGDH